ncbi:MAG: 3-isopropylmalate dehydratase [Anaerolineae bacterium]|jgi:3-isopropylmalate/(R)-2-methylmalate dehydratase small subunit|nr:3-isopropylmalate dehydratase [Anaerolineae bacterium]
MKATQISGRLWVLRDVEGALYNDIDTDMIFHNRYLHITALAQMGQYTLDNLKGWEDFAHRVQAGDLIMAGRNFGSGSSRQQAVDCFRALGIAAIIAESFGAIYKRNAINSGLPLIALPQLSQYGVQFQTGDNLTVNFVTGEVLRNSAELFKAQPFSKVQLAIYEAGNLFEYGKVAEK